MRETLTTTYNKYLLAFWSKRSEFSVMARVSIKKAIKSIVNDSNTKIQAENLEKLLNLMNGNSVTYVSSEESEANEDTQSNFGSKTESDEETGDKKNFRIAKLDGNCFANITSIVIRVKNSI